MLKRKLIFSFPTLVLAILVGSVFVSAQTPEKKPDIEPSKRPIKARGEANDALKKWLLDVKYVITPAERTAFLLLTTDDEREKFIGTFWDRRDPNPDTEENEYRDAYYERMAYANEHFSSGVPGWLTDRGRIYITWGKPDSVEARPSGGSYVKPSYEGSGSATTYPFETWSYRHLDGVGDGIEIEFVDQTGSGEYRIARDLNEKYLTLGPSQIATAGNPNSFVREQDMPFAVAEKLKNLDTPPGVRYSEIESTLVGSPTIDKNPVDVDMQIGFFRQSEGRVIATFTLLAENKDLKFESNAGIETARVNILGRLTSVAGRRVGIFEDSVATNATASELISVKNQKSIYQRVVALAPGIYKVDVIVRDVVTGNRGIVSQGFTVPRYDEKKLSTSTLVLASTLRPTNEHDIGDRFVIGNTKLVPNLSGVYKQGQPVGVYLQVYNAETDQTTLRPNVDVEYVLMKNGKQISSLKEDWSGLSDSSQRLTISRLLPTESLRPGEYQIRLLMKDRVNGQMIENKGNFTITQ